jgi:hypothetical protein
VNRTLILLALAVSVAAGVWSILPGAGEPGLASRLVASPTPTASGRTTKPASRTTPATSGTHRLRAEAENQPGWATLAAVGQIEAVLAVTRRFDARAKTPGGQ